MPEKDTKEHKNLKLNRTLLNRTEIPEVKLSQYWPWIGLQSNDCLSTKMSPNKL